MSFESITAGTDSPLFTVTKGSLDDSELAALTAVVLSLANSNAQEVPSEVQTRDWIRRDALNLRPRAGTGAWRRSF